MNDRNRGAAGEAPAPSRGAPRLDRPADAADTVAMTDPRAATLALLARRAPDATICPSEVARAIAADWRAAMPDVHAAVDALVDAGLVRLSWKGRPMAARSGPYRIGRGVSDPPPE